MISKIVLTSLLAMFLSGGIYTKVTEDCDETTATSTAVSESTATEDVTKAILYNGEVIPMIELPTVEITGSRNTEDLVKAAIIGGEVHPVIELSEIVVIPGT